MKRLASIILAVGLTTMTGAVNRSQQVDTAPASTKTQKVIKSLEAAQDKKLEKLLLSIDSLPEQMATTMAIKEQIKQDVSLTVKSQVNTIRLIRRLEPRKPVFVTISPVSPLPYHIKPPKYVPLPEVTTPQTEKPNFFQRIFKR